MENEAGTSFSTNRNDHENSSVVDIQAWKDRKRRYCAITIDSDSDEDEQTKVSY